MAIGQDNQTLPLIYICCLSILLSVNPLILKMVLIWMTNYNPCTTTSSPSGRINLDFNLLILLIYSLKYLSPNLFCPQQISIVLQTLLFLHFSQKIYHCFFSLFLKSYLFFLWVVSFLLNSTNFPLVLSYLPSENLGAYRGCLLVLIICLKFINYGMLYADSLLAHPLASTGMNSVSYSAT